MEVGIGFLIALAIGLTGIGGGTLTAPVLVLFVNVPAGIAVGTALVFGAAVKLVAAPVYLLRSGVNYRLLAYMLGGAVPGVITGAYLLNRLGARNLNGAVLATVGFTVLFSACVSLMRLRKRAAAPAPDRTRILPWVMFPIGLEVGFSSAGGGALGSLALMQLTSVPPLQVVGTDLVFGLILGSIGGGVHFGLGGVDTATAYKLIAGGIPGVLLGARLASRLPAVKLRLGLSLWLVYVGSQLLYRGLGSMVRGS